eukprot:4799947-Alexandrium_andersonii.AAC.1
MGATYYACITRQILRNKGTLGEGSLGQCEAPHLGPAQRLSWALSGRVEKRRGLGTQGSINRGERDKGQCCQAYLLCGREGALATRATLPPVGSLGGLSRSIRQKHAGSKHGHSLASGTTATGKREAAKVVEKHCSWALGARSKLKMGTRSLHLRDAWCTLGRFCSHEAPLVQKLNNAIQSGIRPVFRTIKQHAIKLARVV